VLETDKEKYFEMFKINSKLGANPFYRNGRLEQRMERNCENDRRIILPCRVKKQSKAVPLQALEALRGRGDIAPTHSRRRY
jgi:hypothetical protein